ncbi:hypothetical protein BOTBODRAFT_168834 [Botryobasidium botryosum FD-172 SS1]|uniref:Uncharacterized protein n=1 Tax=Botryobasidium botryosum (strain FD-172 SS1) TaxID=930990 RepID=A0A067N153_BOTB1|nr:hypothetical protein BOTBODRAFT_168834 [Botryobasidium botryosum FD-172 SS1]
MTFIGYVSGTKVNIPPTTKDDSDQEQDKTFIGPDQEEKEGLENQPEEEPPEEQEEEQPIKEESDQEEEIEPDKSDSNKSSSEDSDEDDEDDDEEPIILPKTPSSEKKPLPFKEGYSITKICWITHYSTKGNDTSTEEESFTITWFSTTITYNFS